MLRLGSVQLETNLLLAPIAGYCDLSFRLLCRGLGGVGLACTDLLSPQGLLRGTAASLDLARTHDLDQPIGMQLYGADPRIMAEGARWAADHGATVIDINMGCPVDKVCKKDGGSKLLTDVDRAQRITESVIRAVELPVTAKMRLGWFDADPVAERLAPLLVEVGVAGVTIHGRSTEQKFRGVVDRTGIRRVVESVDGRVPVIGNGDVREPGDALAMMRETGCQGVMIGRGALSTPWLFRDAWALIEGKNPPEPLDLDARIELIRRYLGMMIEFRGEQRAMTQIRRRISWFGKRLGPCKPLKEAVRTASDPAAVHAALDRFLAERSGDDRVLPGESSRMTGGVGVAG